MADTNTATAYEAGLLARRAGRGIDANPYHVMDTKMRGAWGMGWTDGAIIFAYTREEALADGVLIDAGDMAREVGFKVPVAITGAAWLDCVTWTEFDKRKCYQDEAGRLWDLLYMAGLAVRAAARKNDRTEVLYTFYRVPRGGRGMTAKKVTLKICSGAGDTGEHVITIMLPDED